MPFEDSRRLTGSNLFFDSPGAVLETLAVDVHEALLAGWQRRVALARSSLGWPAGVESPVAAIDPQRKRALERARSIAIRPHAAATSLALAAPCDQLFTATEINEWAFCAALFDADPVRWGALEDDLGKMARRAALDAGPVSPGERPPVFDERAALERFAVLSKLEAAPGLRELSAAAAAHGLPTVLDDDALTMGYGVGGCTWPLEALPDSSQIPWAQLRAVPAAIVTGSNGKTTTVRVLAACVQAQGLSAGYNCTDGWYIAGEQIGSGDYSGPVGTRAVLRDRRVEAAILETARGGILRRGLAAGRADVALITNVSADHFGEYGIHDLAGIADVKLVVASTVGAGGLLVLNADDTILRSRGGEMACPIGWFAHDYLHATLQAHRAKGGATSGVHAGRLVVSGVGRRGEHDLGAIADMPLTVNGTAEYNIANVAGAALAAMQIGMSADIVAAVLARFGADPADNPGRLMRYEYRGAQVLLDYAHNPEGLRGLLTVAARLRRMGRVALVLGQAGNREAADMECLAATAAQFQPDLVVIKEIESYLRGRAPGEVPTILRSALLGSGMRESALEVCPTELEAVRRVLDWSKPGDVLVLPVHDRAARAATVDLIHSG